MKSRASRRDDASGVADKMAYSQQRGGRRPIREFEDNRPEANAQALLQDAVNRNAEDNKATQPGSTNKQSELNIGGGFDGEKIYASDNVDFAAVFLHEIGHAALKHRPPSLGQNSRPDLSSTRSKIDHTMEREADAAGAKVQNVLGPDGTNTMLKTASEMSTTSSYPPGPILPLLVDGVGQPLSRASIKKLLGLAEYRHGDEEKKNLKVEVNAEQEKSRQINLRHFVTELKGEAIGDAVPTEGEKKKKRVGHLLELILHHFQDADGLERGDGTDKDAWEDFEDATQFIRDVTTNIPDFNTAHNSMSLRFPRAVRHVGQEQWQAAAVAAMRAGWLTRTGFGNLRISLGILGVTIRISGDVTHEAALQPGVNVGGVVIPQYLVTDENLNNALSYYQQTFQSGRYYERLGVILKSLDWGHQLVDKWENYSHRTRGRQVDKNVNFKFLALLSPRDGSQEVIGANGRVLGDGSYMFTIDADFRVRYMPAANYVGEGGTSKNFFQFIPHSQLASLGHVVAAGNYVIANGRFRWIDNGSGHYRVKANINESNSRAALQNLGYQTDEIAFRDRGNHDLDATYEQGNKVLPGLPRGDKRPAMTPEIKALQDAMDRMK